MKTRNIKGQTYVAAVLLVTSRKADGTFNECRRVADDESITLEGGEEFVIAFVPEVVLKRTAN